MASLRPAPSRYRSSLLALATVAAALAAAPKAQAQGIPEYEYMYWGGGSGNFSGSWRNVTGQFVQPDWGWTNLYFGEDGDGNSVPGGSVYNDVQYDLPMVGMFFYNHDWVVNGKSLRMIDWECYLGIGSSNISVTVNASIRLDGVFGIKPHFSVAVPLTSKVILNGEVTGVGALYKSGLGTAELRGFHNYTEGTCVDAGRLIDHNPHGNYRINGGLEFSIDSLQTSTGDIRGGGFVVKSGYSELTFSGGTKDYSGGTIVNEGRLTVEAPSNSSSYSINGDSQLEFNVSTNRTYANPIGGTGTFIKRGKGTLTLSHAQNDMADVLVAQGRLVEVDPNDADRFVQSGELQFNVDSDWVYRGWISGGGSFIKDGAGTLTLAGTATYVGGTTVLNGRLIDPDPEFAYNVYGALEFRTTGEKTFSDFISGNGSFTKSGDGVLTLTRASTYAGGTTVNGGRLIDRNPHGDYVTNANLEFANATNVDFWTVDMFGKVIPNKISGTGNFTKSGAGALRLLGPLAYAGSTMVNGGALVLADNDILPTATALTVGANGTLLTDRRQTVGSLAGEGKVNSVGGGLTVSGSASTTFSGVFSGSGGSLTKAGSGTLTLSGINTYTGGTTVNGGRLIDANPHGAYVTNAVLEFAKSGDYSYATAITGTGSFTKSGAGVLTLGAANAYTGTTTVSGGTLRLGAGGSLAASSTMAVDPGATFDLNGRAQTFAGLQGGGAVTLGAGALTVRGGAFSGTISGTGSLIKRSTDTLTLSGTNTYAGGTSVLGGRLVVLNPHGNYANNGALEFQTAANAARTFSGVVSGTGEFAKSGAGTLTLTGANTYTGLTYVDAGRLIDQNPHGDYAVTGALEFQTTGDKTLSGDVYGVGSLIKSGAGTLELAKAPTNFGGVRVSGGTLSVGGAGALDGGLAVDSGATLENASGGALTIKGQSVNRGEILTGTGSTTLFDGPISGAGDFVGAGTVRFDGGYGPGNGPASVRFGGDLTLGSANVLTMELGGTTLGTGYDHLNVLGTAALGGALKVVSINGFSPALGQSFDLFDLKSSNGAFGSISLPTLRNGMFWNASALYTTGTVQAVPEPASLAALGLGGLALLRRRKR